MSVSTRKCRTSMIAVLGLVLGVSAGILASSEIADGAESGVCVYQTGTNHEVSVKAVTVAEGAWPPQAALTEIAHYGPGDCPFGSWTTATSGNLQIDQNVGYRPLFGSWSSCSYVGPVINSGSSLDHATIGIQFPNCGMGDYQTDGYGYHFGHQNLFSDHRFSGTEWYYM